MNVRDERKRRGLRAIDLARKAGISHAYGWLIENGVNPSLTVKHRIARVLKKRIHDLFPD